MKAKVKQDAKAGKAQRGQKESKWKSMTPEEQAALRESDPLKANAQQFGKFAGYDVASQGGKGFDKKDLKHLQEEGWSNNEIMQAAASSNYINAPADRQLGMLNRELDWRNSKDRKILEKGKDVLGYMGLVNHGGEGSGIRFLGGDPSKKKNWLLGDPTAEYGTNRADWEVTRGGITGAINSEFNRHNKVQGPVYEWGGRNADGTANALGGFEYKHNGSNQAMVRTTSWAMPKELSNMRFAERMDAAEGHRKPDAGDGTTGSDSSTDGEAKPEPLPAYDFTPAGADYGVKPFQINTGTSIFDAFADSIGNGQRFAASEAVKQRLGFA